MAVYYVDFVNGADANNGLGPDASHASNKPWKTIGKLLGAAGMASGDTAYLAPGSFRETVTVAMTSAVAETKVIGDPTNSRGFKTSGGVLVTPGPVVHTAFTTDDKTAIAGAILLTLAGRDFLTFQNIHFMGGNGTPTCIGADSTTSTNTTFTDCSFQSGHGAAQTQVQITAAAGVALHWLFDRCLFIAAPRNAVAGHINLILNRHTADYDVDVIAKNCLFMSGGTIGLRVSSTGAGTGFAGGVIANACTFMTLTGMATADANLSTTIPCQCNNSFLYCGTGLNANAAGQITETYNSFCCNTARTNVTAGTGSQTAYAPLFHFGQELQTGTTQVRPFLTPTSGSPLLAFGAGTSPPTVDQLNRNRPSGGNATTIAAGGLERHEFGTRETVTIDTGGLAVKLTGPGDHQFVIPVTSGHSTTVTLKCNFDATHGTGTPPQAQLVANGAIGYNGETVTAAASTGTWLTLSFAAFTPTANGYVILRLVSRSAAANGTAVFDTVTIT